MKKRLIVIICFILMTIMTACVPEKGSPINTPKTSEETADEAADKTSEEAENENQGPTVDELMSQAEEAIEKEDFDSALALAKEAGAIDPAAESAIIDLVKTAYGKKIDNAIDAEDYETAMSLIEEADNKLGITDFEEKLSGIPDAVKNHVEFADSISVENPVTIIFTEQKGDDWYINEDPECTSKDSGCTLTLTDVKEGETEDGQKEYTIDYETDLKYTAVFPKSYGYPYWFCYAGSLDFYDYYTGRRFNVSETSLDPGVYSKEGETINRITWKGKEYDIVIRVQKERYDGDVIRVEKDGFYETSCSTLLKYTFTVTCPKDYDGLCAYVYKPEGYPADAWERIKRLSYDEDGKQIAKETDVGEFYTFKDEDDIGFIPKADDVAMIRVDDYLRSDLR